MSKVLEKTANVAIIAFAIVAAGLLSWRHFASPPPPLAAEDRIQPGELLEGVEVPEGRVFLLALQPDCRYCSESLPFYRSIIEGRDSEGLSLPVIGVVADDDQLADEREVLRAADVRLDALTAGNFRKMRILGSPTMLLVEDGRLVELWQGQRTEEDGGDILDALGLGELCAADCGSA